MISLEQRLSRSLASVLALLVVVVIAGTFATLRTLLRSELDDTLLARARTLTAPTAPGGRGFSLHFIEWPPPEFQPGPNAECFEVRSADGTLVDRSPSLGDRTLGVPPYRAGDLGFFDVILPGGQPGRAVSIALGLDDTPSSAEGSRPQFIVTFARSTLHQRQVLRWVTAGFVAGGAILIFATARLVRVTTRSGLRPVSDLARRVTAIEATSLDKRLPVALAPVELAPIVEQLNSLLDRLRAAFERERRFSSNVAHELLTPVSELQALAENAVRWPRDPEATAGLASDVLDSTHYMDRTVRTLLALARNERGDAVMASEPVDLGGLIDDLCAGSTVRAAARGVTIECEAPPVAMTRSDGPACRTVLQNLIENAVEYCPAGGHVQVTLDSLGGGLQVRIGNSNNHLESADLPRLTEPFWRKDGARSDRLHAGLGLALVDSLARMLRLELRFELPRPNWFEVSLRFPKA